MKSGASRFIPMALVGVIAVLLVVVFVWLGRLVFGAKDSTPPKAVESTSQTAKKPDVKPESNTPELTSLLANRAVRITVRGPIVADENYRSYTITVSPGARNMTTYKGYKLEQIDSEQLQNTSKAYGELVFALDRAHLMVGDELTSDANDTRGICATGSLYEFELLEDGKTTKRLWTSTCKGSPGSLKANLNQVMNLFTNQIPDYSKQLSKMNSRM